MPVNVQTLFLAPVMGLIFLAVIPLLAHQLWTKGSVTFRQYGRPILVLRGWKASLALSVLFPISFYAAASFFGTFLVALGLTLPDWLPQLPVK